MTVALCLMRACKPAHPTKFKNPYITTVQKSYVLVDGPYNQEVPFKKEKNHHNMFVCVLIDSFFFLYINLILLQHTLQLTKHHNEN